MNKLIIFIFFTAMVFGQPFDEKDPREIIEKVRIYRLTQELDLTTEQATKFFPRLNELRKIEQVFQKERMDIIFELKKMVKNNVPDNEIAKSISRYETVLEKKAEGQKKIIQEMKEVLTPTQQAKYLIFQEEFEREIRELIREVKKRHPDLE